MSLTGIETNFEERIARLEHRVSDTIAAGERRADVLEGRMSRLEHLAPPSSRPATTDPARPPAISPPRPAGRAADPRDPAAGRPGKAPPARSPVEREGAIATPVSTAASPSPMTVGDLVGGRVLAWAGGVSTLVGIVLFLVLAVSHGWIGEQMRVVLAGAASLGLVAVGVWLQAKPARTEAATVMVGTGTAGLFATLVVAGEVYRLIPPPLSIGASMAVGALATALAIRWAGRAIGALGLGGALLSPLLVGAPSSTATIAVLGVAAACAMWVVVWQQWRWLGFAAVLVCAPQWAGWALGGQPPALELAVLVGFAALGLAGGVGADLRSVGSRRRSSSLALLVLNACVAAVTGYVALRHTIGLTSAELWLAGLAGAHATVGLSRNRLGLSREVGQALLVIAVVLADVALGLSARAAGLAVGWGAAAVALAWLSQRASRTPSDRALMDLGVGGHVALVLIRALIDAPPGQVGPQTTAAASLLPVAALAATCLACARLTDRKLGDWRNMLDGLGLLAIAYITAGALEGPALVAAWALEGVALTQLARRTGEKTAQLGGVAFLGGAAVHALAVEAPPAALLTGASDLGAATVALGTLAVAALQAARAVRTQAVARAFGPWLIGGSGVTLLYLASIAVVTAFAPTPGGAIDNVLDLSVRQQGQVLLSGLWSVVGLGVLIVGLRRRLSAVRSGALALLLVTVAKVFLYDLSTLNSVYRVISFLVLGVLLLAGAFLYQRLRPPPQPDLRRAPGRRPRGAPQVAESPAGRGVTGRAEPAGPLVGCGLDPDLGAHQDDLVSR